MCDVSVFKLHSRLTPLNVKNFKIQFWTWFVTCQVACKLSALIKCWAKLWNKALNTADQRSNCEMGGQKVKQEDETGRKRTGQPPPMPRLRNWSHNTYPWLPHGLLKGLFLRLGPRNITLHWRCSFLSHKTTEWMPQFILSENAAPASFTRWKSKINSTSSAWKECLMHQITINCNNIIMDLKTIYTFLKTKSGVFSKAYLWNAFTDNPKTYTCTFILKFMPSVYFVQ